MDTQPFRAGHVAVIGRPNVGKSTLVNALVGFKISITSNRPQTTRHRLLGIATFPHGQLLLVDTPGLHREQKRAMNRWMNRAARGALEGVDAALLVIEAGRWDDEDTLAYEALKEAGVPGRARGQPGRPHQGQDHAAALPGEDRAGARVRGRPSDFGTQEERASKRWSTTCSSCVPEQAALYGEDEITDKSQRFLAGELVREQLMRQLGAELPYATTVEIEKFELDGRMWRIGAVIWVERDGQKAIVIGNKGERLREIGTRARMQMERLFDGKVFLETWVRVREGWSDDEAALRTLGYHD